LYHTKIKAGIKISHSHQITIKFDVTAKPSLKKKKKHNQNSRQLKTLSDKGSLASHCPGVLQTQ